MSLAENHFHQKISFSANWITRGCASVALPVAEIWPKAPAVSVVLGFRNKARFGMLNISARNSSLRRSSMLVILATLTSMLVRVGPRNAFRPNVPYVRCEGLVTGSNPWAAVNVRADLEKALGSKK